VARGGDDGGRPAVQQRVGGTEHARERVVCVGGRAAVVRSEPLHVRARK
jgi:hypothetical protein